MKETKANLWERFEAPIIVVSWLFGYWAPWLSTSSGTAWLALSSWAVAHGLHDLQTGSRLVTGSVALCAVLGAILRVVKASTERPRITLQQAGLLLTCTPLSVLLPVGGAVLFLVALAAVSLYGWCVLRALQPVDPTPSRLWQRLLRESFPILVAGCFLTMSWQYNAQWLMRGLVISAGISLLARAALPMQRASGS